MIKGHKNVIFKKKMFALSFYPLTTFPVCGSLQHKNIFTPHLNISGRAIAFLRIHKIQGPSTIHKSGWPT